MCAMLHGHTSIPMARYHRDLLVAGVDLPMSRYDFAVYVRNSHPPPHWARHPSITNHVCVDVFSPSSKLQVLLGWIFGKTWDNLEMKMPFTSPWFMAHHRKHKPNYKKWQTGKTSPDQLKSVLNRKSQSLIKTIETNSAKSLPNRKGNEWQQ